MNPTLSLNIIRYNAPSILSFCNEFNVLSFKFEDSEKYVHLATITNARIIVKQRSSIRLFLLMFLSVLFNLAVAAIFTKVLFALLTVFVLITKPRSSYKLLLNFRGGTFCEIPLQKKDTAIANKLLQALLNNG